MGVISGKFRIAKAQVSLIMSLKDEQGGEGGMKCRQGPVAASTRPIYIFILVMVNQSSHSFGVTCVPP